MTIRLVIADDHAMIRAGLRLVAENAHGIEVVGEAADGGEAVAVTRRERPDVLLLDLAMPDVDGLEAARTLLAGPAPPRIVMLTTFGSDENLHRALRTGVNGFLLKSSPPEHLIEAIRVAAAGDGLIDPAVTMRVVASFAARPVLAPPPELDTLTERERDVLHLLARGLSNREIAAEAGVGEATVRTHVAQILRKLGLRDRVQAVVLAYESGIVRPGEP
ncbi:DNA-binding NarL/FixJ family response regulator [Thermocatellispora tengchongensis]|uniref:DNA-binding NarL/FixJ family response regulator n=1 Tax=Thermocatellispora tengchongensis TaxID=1073253 RepID=A0A840P1P2_9ACTN|nr:response regulator transcription factor [Thermocatellispora tengchongensis]MBB5132386.1 DNA-binding NarL/FixJ family response regulator [Thermocatellispora tengchongensis]